MNTQANLRDIVSTSCLVHRIRISDGEIMALAHQASLISGDKIDYLVRELNKRKRKRMADWDLD